MIYFSSELIAKSIWSGEKTSTQACHEKQGNRASFPSWQHSLERRGGGGVDAAALTEGQIGRAQ